LPEGGARRKAEPAGLTQARTASRILATSVAC
jgi:hypothetical protein